MDHGEMHIQPEYRHVIHTTNYNQGQQRIIRSSSANFSRSFEPSEMQYNNERPMMLDTYTQTSHAELGVNDDYMLNVYMEQQRHRENALLEKINVLKAELRAHSEMISQMHSTNAQTSSSIIQRQPNRQQQQQHTTVIANPQQSTSPQMQLYHAQSSEEEILPHEPQAQLDVQQELGHNNDANPRYVPQEMNIGAESATQQNGSVSRSTHTIINTTQEVRSRNVNYTIIADGDSNGHDGPIEIEIAEDENAPNLNCSADSERLEICLTEDQQSEANASNIKYEVDNEQNSTEENSTEDNIQIQRINTTTSSASPVSPKRRKRSSENLTHYPEQQIFEVRELSVGASSESSETPESMPFTPLSANRNRASLLNLPVQPQRRNGGQNTPAEDQLEPEELYCSIGPNNTRVPTKIFDSINWKSPSLATRKLMRAVFDRKTLATHSMTGKPSPAFKDHNKPLKKMLNPRLIQDIIFAVTRRSQVSEKEVRNAITTKCADENKMWKLEQTKKNSLCEQDKENVA